MDGMIDSFKDIPKRVRDDGLLMKAFFDLVLFLIFSVFCFYAILLVSLSLTTLWQSGFTEETLDVLVSIFISPALVWKIVIDGSFVPHLILPLIFILAFILFFVLYVLKTIRILSLAYSVKNKYARYENIEKMGLFGSSIMILGKAFHRLVSFDKPASVLVFATPGMGKTSTLAIPSILTADDANLLAVDEHGLLFKHTAGYRKTLGKVFLMDWDVMDEGKSFYPRWNPLSPKNIPPKGELRDAYLNCIARNLLSKTEDTYWHRLVNQAMEGLLNCFADKIEQAYANDYFLSKMMNNGRLSKEDKDILLSYYGDMPKKYSISAIQNVQSGKMNIDNYLPIGSWVSVPSVWMGKELCLAFCVDCLLQRYFMITKEKDTEGWRGMLDVFIKEAKFFGYNSKAVQVLEYLYYLPRKQRDVVFTMMLEPLEVFLKQSVRERTSVSDFTYANLRVNKNFSIYCKGGSVESGFMTKFMFDMILDEREISSPCENNLLVIMDDMEKFRGMDALVGALENNHRTNTSFLLMSTNVEALLGNYKKETLEEVIGNSGNKIISAANSDDTAKILQDMARFATRTVQVPLESPGILSGFGKGFSDADYYLRIAKGLMMEKGNKFRKGRHMLLCEGYYHMPVELEAFYFLKDQDLAQASKIGVSSLLDIDLFKKRNVQDMEVPSISDVLHEAGINIATEDEVGIFLREKFSEASTIIEGVKSKREVLGDDISSRWKSRDVKVENVSMGEDWWMKSDSFKSLTDEVNPFMVKK